MTPYNTRNIIRLNVRNEYCKLELVEQKSGKSIYFHFKEKGKNILTLTVIIDMSSKCQVLVQIKKIAHKVQVQTQWVI